MKNWYAFLVALVILAELRTMNAQSWTSLLHQPPFRASTALLLTDGTVMVQDYDSLGHWWKLTPDRFGSYINGTWLQLAPMPTGYAPYYFASAVLRDGRVIVMGGEYNEQHTVQSYTNLGAIYDPISDTWTAVNPPPGWTTIGSGPSTTLADGRFVLGSCCSTEVALLDAATLTWASTGGKAEVGWGETWTSLPNGQVLTVDIDIWFGCRRNYDTELYYPPTSTWSFGGRTPISLPDIYCGTGPAILRPDGTVFATGATGVTAIYDTTTGLWSQGPTFPRNADGSIWSPIFAPAALLPSGNVLVSAYRLNLALGVSFFEFDGANLLVAPSTPNSINDWQGRMLVLPTGQILYADGSSDVEIYTSSGAPNPAWRPTITKVASTLTRTKTFTVQGRQLNGMSAGSQYGGRAQTATNYPLVRIVNEGTGRVVYVRTRNHSSMGVATGNLIVSTQFTVPANIDLGVSELYVVANGIASQPVGVTIE